jgi:hypothetical protein
MKFAKSSCRAAGVRQPSTETSAYISGRAVGIFCLEDGVTLEALFTFAVFVLIFAIGLGLGILTRGP